MEISSGNGEVKEVSALSKDLKKQLDYLEDIDQLELQENTEDFAEFEKYEIAYKNLKEQDAPDLWARIEAGIAEENIMPIKKRKKKYVKYIAVFSTMAAAILLCLAVLPVVIDGMNQSDMMSSMDNAISSSSESEKSASEESEDSYTMNNAETNGLNAEESVSQEKDTVPEEDTEKKNSDSKGETETKNEQSKEEAVELIEIEDILEEDLEKIAFSTLSKASQKQIKELVENYKKCTFYIDETGTIYMIDEDIKYELRGAHQVEK